MTIDEIDAYAADTLRVRLLNDVYPHGAQNVHLQERSSIIDAPVAEADGLYHGWDLHCAGALKQVNSRPGASDRNETGPCETDSALAGNAGSAPEPAARDRGASSERAELGPHDIRIHSS